MAACRSLHCLSTAMGGEVSRIVPVLEPGAGVVTSRADVHYVVTEHGIAYLHGKTLRERAEALIAIADPRVSTGVGRFCAALALPGAQEPRWLPMPETDGSRRGGAEE